jgi:DNA-binding transcriptional ArsR family regulator
VTLVLVDVPDDLDRPFAALANHHRRAMVHLLAFQPYSISRLAALRGLSLPAINKHVRVLEEAGMIRRRKHGRTTFLTLDRASVRSLQSWLGQYHAYWGTESESLENYAAFLAEGPSTGKEIS